MAEVYYEDSESNVLCFRHAVKAVIENDERITARAEEQSNGDDTGWFPFCKKCSDEIEKEREEDGAEDEVEGEED